MEVLTKILQQGTEFETLAETALADRYDRLVELVTMIGDKGELPITMALANVVDNQHLVRPALAFSSSASFHLCISSPSLRRSPSAIRMILPSIE